MQNISFSVTNWVSINNHNYISKDTYVYPNSSIRIFQTTPEEGNEYNVETDMRINGFFTCDKKAAMPLYPFVSEVNTLSFTMFNR